MKRILMSIKPEYAYAILYGHKQYEYRKRLELKEKLKEAEEKYKAEKLAIKKGLDKK